MPSDDLDGRASDLKRGDKHSPSASLKRLISRLPQGERRMSLSGPRRGIDVPNGTGIERSLLSS